MWHQNIYKEACVENNAEALRAVQLGADRLEYCSDLAADGLTPAVSEIALLLAQIDIPVKVMIRPRAGDFCYDQKELETMLQSIQAFKQLPVAGLVTGMLTKDKQLAIDQLKILAEAAAPLSITFHKAIDEVADKRKALQQLKKINGIDSILTSGGADTALNGASTLKEMIAWAGEQLRIIPAGKITIDNLQEVHESIGAQEYHGRRIVGIL